IAPRDVERYLESRTSRGIAQPRTGPVEPREQKSGPYYRPRFGSPSEAARSRPRANGRFARTTKDAPASGQRNGRQSDALSVPLGASETSVACTDCDDTEQP